MWNEQRQNKGNFRYDNTPYYMNPEGGLQYCDCDGHLWSVSGQFLRGHYVLLMCPARGGDIKENTESGAREQLRKIKTLKCSDSQG